jgi:hypothetical protein
MTGHDLDAVLASIDGALADGELPDAMRWTPAPETVEDAGDPYTEDRWSPLTTLRGEIRYPWPRPVDSVTGQPTPYQWGRGPVPERVGARCSIVPVFPTRPLTMPEAVAYALRAEQHRDDYERSLEQLRDLFAPAAEAIAGLVDTFGKIAADVGMRFSELVEALAKLSRDPRQPIPPPRRLRDEDPKAYALALRQARGTGPDRQVQHRPRPRRHAQ